jgi:hypothetical protein
MPLAHHFCKSLISASTPVAQVSLFLGVVCSVMFGLSRPKGDFLMSMISLVIGMAFSCFTGTLTPAQRNVLAEVPHRIDAVLQRFNIDGRTTTFAMCPSCHGRHAPEFKPGSATPIYPKFCRNHLLEQGVCGAPLLGEHGPIRPFVYHHVDDYIGGLMSDPELAKHIDQACDNLTDSIKANKPPPTFVTDVFDAEFLRTFQGPDGSLFVDRNGESRIPLSLNVDGFNVERLTIRGARTSCTIISMACLSLPLSIRYRPENLYLAGIIPGPHEPSVDELNQYLAPLVNDAEISWHRGVRYQRTALSDTPRIVRYAIVCQVCDLKGARRLAAFSQPKSHHFCSVCTCHGLTNVGRCDHENWVKKDVSELRHWAEKWRDATTLRGREIIYSKHGVQWSELWRLPYYDPTRQLVVDAMHCIFEGLVSFHFRDLLQLTTKDGNKKTQYSPVFSHVFRKPLPKEHPDYQALDDAKKLTPPQISEVSQIHELLTLSLDAHGSDREGQEESLASKIEKRRKPAIMFVFDDVCPRTMSATERTKCTKKWFATELVKWVRSFCFEFFFSYSLPLAARQDSLFCCSPHPECYLGGLTTYSSRHQNNGSAFVGGVSPW